MRLSARSGRRWRRAGIAVLALVALALVGVGGAAADLRLRYAGEPSEQARSRGRDAVWLGHAWVDGRKSDADLAALTRLVAGTGIHDLYVHAGPLEHDGSLPAARYPGAADFVTRAHRALPGIRVQAWLGDLVAPEKDGLHLDQPAVRDRIVASAGQVLDAGFDGVHFDLEPVWSGSPGFLALLDQTHELTSARGVPLSVAAPQIDPLPGLGTVSRELSGHGKWWSQGYFAAVARRVEQVAVMSYDTGLPAKSLYGGYVGQQTELALRNTPPGTDLVMGLPAYWQDDSNHHGDAETVPAAVRGARLALGSHGRANFGLALYADFSATPADWTAYREGWGGLASHT